ncbi:MAG: tRNA (adenosine(37)-N6)-threonylcarbamoyltransferase complex dimerization subunit type 1 TsaB [Pseudomonadales bacterium]|nr:tRNA (adenosine(37)-N6)-threonylcarbamoyltransferase complex dimerization subunit type 1 TsaB [Pseudomonadales bacterium]
MATILAIDSSCDICSVALQGANGVFVRESKAPRQHAAEILTMVDELLLESGYSMTDINAVAVITGPGSFTGLRIGIAVAQGLAFPGSIPVIPFSSLAAMAMLVKQQYGSQQILTAFQSRENEFYFAAWQITDDWPCCIAAEQIVNKNGLLMQLGSLSGSWFAAGNAWSDEVLDSAQLHLAGSDRLIKSSAASILPASISRLAAADVIQAEELLPVYLQEQLVYSAQQGLS